MAKRHKNKGHKAHSHGRGLSKTRGSSSRGRGGGGGRAKTGAGRAIDPSNQYPELMDLESNVYIPETSMKGSMKMGSRRPGRLADEAIYTNKHLGETMQKALRKNPIVFVKAKEVYDPSAELFKKIAEKSLEDVGTDAKVEVVEDKHQIHKVQDHVQSQETIKPKKISVEFTPQVEKEEPVEVRVLADLKENEEDDKEEGEVVMDNEKLFYVDETGDDTKMGSDTVNNKGTIYNDLPSKNPIQPTPKINQDEQTQDTQDTGKSCIEFDPTFSIGNVFLNSKVQKDGSLQANLPKITKYQAAQNYIQQVMSNNNIHMDTDDEEDDDMNTSEEEFIMNASEYEQDDDEVEEEDVSEIEKLSIKDKEPEYGFLEEDFQFDVSSISITNVRVSTDLKQFYLRSFKVLGVDEYIWIDGDDLSEFLIDNGMAGHRVEAYYQYVMNELGLNDEVEEQPNYSDVYISETSEEEEDEEEDDDGLDTLVEYTKRGKIFVVNDDDIPPTESIKTTGKGSNRRIDLNHLDDLELIESLQDQYLSHKKSRKDKKQGKTKQESEYNLMAKYQYLIHIKDIKNEFEEFLHDGNRSALTFPPLDPHGLKTLKKLAGFYNMKSRKFGTGTKTHIVVIKSKRTFHQLPYYHDIDRILKQRPIFNRIDVKRTKDEIEMSKDGSKTRGGAKSKAHIKEGDIVGDRAPEIGQENIGRRLLEKLGWTKGEGLGIDNKGISQPIVAKIKNTKLGIK